MPYEFARLGVSPLEFGFWLSFTGIGYFLGNILNRNYADRRSCNKETTGGENIARKSAPRNGPSKTGRPSGKGRGNNPSKK